MKNVLVLGLDGAGKTLLVRQLAAMLVKSKRSLLDRLVATASPSSSSSGPPDEQGSVVNPDTQPTIGVEHAVLPFESRACSFCEVGAQLLPMWRAYFAGCDLWIFVIDLNNASQLAGAAIELFSVLSDPEMRRKPKLLLLNKVDAYFTLDDTVVRAYLCLDELLSSPEVSPIAVQKASALTGQHMDQVIKWVNQSVTTSSSSSSSSLVAAVASNANGTASTNTTGRFQSARAEVRVHAAAPTN
jgi:GTPase SAR1 family protein